MGLDRPVQGTGTNIKRKKQINNLIPDRVNSWGCSLQVGFKSASDYETFVWVREDELPETNEVIQVTCKVTHLYNFLDKYFMNVCFINMHVFVLDADICG